MLVQIPNVLTREDARRICGRLARANFIDGGRTAGHLAAGVKNNLELPPAQERLELGRQVSVALAANAGFNSFALVRRMMIPIFSRYDEGMAYGAHTDEGILGMDTPDDSMRNDLALTLFLSEPENYDGGELSVETPVGAHGFKLPAGHAVVYPSHYLHEVRRVTRGVRFAAITWIQSYVREAERRAVLHELGTASANLRRQGIGRADTDAMFNVYQKLLRMWASP
jgi:PKHD-type hydroxylase